MTLVVTRARELPPEVFHGGPEAGPGHPCGPWMVSGCSGLTPPWTPHGSTRRPVMGRKPPAWAEAHRWRVLHFDHRKRRNRPPAWMAGGGGGPTILLSDPMESFFKTNPYDGPDRILKTSFSSGNSRFRRAGTPESKMFFTKRTQMIGRF